VAKLKNIGEEKKTFSLFPFPFSLKRTQLMKNPSEMSKCVIAVKGL
jgi:hypothetical protein